VIWHAIKEGREESSILRAVTVQTPPWSLSLLIILPRRCFADVASNLMRKESKKT